MYYDRNGQPMDRDAWVRAFENPEAKIVARDDIDGVIVSTVWLGLDHGFGGPPVIFETMIFGGDKDGDQWRYTTEEDALVGHRAAVFLVENRD